MTKIIITSKKEIDLPVTYEDFDGELSRTDFLMTGSEYTEREFEHIKQSPAYKSYMKKKWIDKKEVKPKNAKSEVKQEAVTEKE